LSGINGVANKASAIIVDGAARPSAPRASEAAARNASATVLIEHALTRGGPWREMRWR